MSRSLTLIPGGGGHDCQVRPSARQQARTAGHPSVTVFDRERHADVAELPPDVWHALNIVGHYVRVPGAVSREVALEQVDVLAAWYRPDPARPVKSDDAPASGYPRPAGVS